MGIQKLQTMVEKLLQSDLSVVGTSTLKESKETLRKMPAQPNQNKSVCLKHQAGLCEGSCEYFHVNRKDVEMFQESLDVMRKRLMGFAKHASRVLFFDVDNTLKHFRKLVAEHDNNVDNEVFLLFGDHHRAMTGRNFA